MLEDLMILTTDGQILEGPGKSAEKCTLHDEFSDVNEEIANILRAYLATKKLDLNNATKVINEREESGTKAWNHLLKVSIRVSDINTAIFCLSKLKNARVVRDVKHLLARNQDENLSLALISSNLGMYDEAEKLYKQSNNPNALSAFYQARNEWQKAIECVDKLNVRTVYYNYAKHLENNENNLQEAIKYYEKSGTHKFEVPRMLFEVEGNSLLQNYCLQESDEFNYEDSLYLSRWWGQYCESLGDISQALSAYEKANDYYNLVRLLCYTGESERAKNIINSLNSTSSTDNDRRRAAQLHLGRHLESTAPLESITYYLSCGAIKHAIRVCIVNNLVNDLMRIVINYGSKKEAVNLIERQLPTIEESVEQILDDSLLVQLYHKCGLLDIALSHCFRSRLWAQARSIMENALENLEERGPIPKLSNETLQMGLDVLKSQSDIIDIIIDMILFKNDDKSIIQKLIIEYNVEVNEKLIEKVEKIFRKENDPQLISLLGDMALQQGQYFTAAKLYNSIGNRADSVKALIRTGSTDRIINYANIARDKAVYRIVANYLQTINYSDERTITTFYKKAGTKQELIRFKKENND